MSSLKPTVVGLGVSMPLLAAVAVALRLEARRIKRVRLGADDYTIIAALIFAIALCVSMLADVYCGNLGGHMPLGPDGIPPNSEEYVIFAKIHWTLQFLSVLGFGFTKLSVILLYRRIFVSRTFRIVTWIVEGLVYAWTMGFFFLNLLDCLPISINWRSRAGDPTHCVDVYALFVSMSVSDVILDTLILALPWYPVWKLQMPLRRKLSICAIFLLGGFVVAAGIVRFAYLLQATRNIASNLDYTYSRAPAIYWTAVEGCIGVVSACLPTLRPIFNQRTTENLIQSIRDRIAPGSIRKRSQNTLSSGPSHYADHASDLSLVARPHDRKKSRYQTRAEAASTQHPPKLARNILVHTDLSQRDEMV
ncbi:MAG: hypothetical protein LQ346_007459 [Caloplaca aetnensis]|nr:MAG: hypothetical protein LQ346_007459 [Caloplaca aetnensis]